MPASRYIRNDLTVTVRTVDGALAFESLFGLLVLERDVTGEAAIVRLAEWLRPHLLPLGFTAVDEFTMPRIVYRVIDPKWQAIDWERAVPDTPSPWDPLLGLFVAVRESRVQPRMSQWPFAVPARTFEIGPEPAVAAAVDRVVSGSRDGSAIVVEAAPLADAEDVFRALSWPTAEILHFRALAPAGDLLRTSAVDVPGALGWILRRSSAWKTRLIVIEADEDALPMVRRLGHEIVERAGPAVIVIPSAKADLVALYAALLHDRPLDFIQRIYKHLTLFTGAGREEALRFSMAAERLTDPECTAAIVSKVRGLSGQRIVRPPRRKTIEVRVITTSIKEAARQLRLDVRPEGVRLGWQYVPKRIRFGDAVATRMLRSGYIVRPLDAQMTSLGWSNEYIPMEMLVERVEQNTLSLEEVLDPSSGPNFEEIVIERLLNLGASVKELRFEDSEGDGTLPVAQKTIHIRELVETGRLLGAAGRVEKLRPTFSQRFAAPRHVNAWFLHPTSDGGTRRLPQQETRLARGEEVHLGVQIGARDANLVTVATLALDERAFRWLPNQTGCWIAIGITPLDFDLLGSPVQEVWLPRTGETQLVSFPVVPKSTPAIAGVARLRFTVYFRGNVVQSFRIAARLDNAPDDAAAGMARALDISVEEIPDRAAGYLTRLEYSAADFAHVEALRARSLSIVANDSAGEKVFTISGADYFSSSVNNEVTPLVEDARLALRAASYNDVASEYRYGADNGAAREELLGLTWDVAKAGWRLFSQIVPDPDDQAAIAKSLGHEGTIHAAHIDLRQVIPWSLIYDLPIDDGVDRRAVLVDGVKETYPVRRAVCEAGLPLADRSVPTEACGVSADCILHGAGPDGCKQVGKEFYCRETVVCPRHFWGFAHHIEVPAQQAKGKQPPPTVPPAIVTSRPAALAIGYNPNFETAKPHLEALRKLANLHVEEPDPVERNEILQLLKRVQPDLVYLYCHAWIDELANPGRYSPNLDFGHRAKTDTVFNADLTGPAWTHHPLVFLNGCSTLGFNAAAPSGFITTLIQGRKASAVIGTEVTVWERLASEMALIFLEEFLGVGGETAKSAGAALTRARRRLLLKNNPLGLVYTLYGSADVHLEFT